MEPAVSSSGSEGDEVSNSDPLVETIHLFVLAQDTP